MLCEYMHLRVRRVNYRTTRATDRAEQKKTKLEKPETNVARIVICVYLCVLIVVY